MSVSADRTAEIIAAMREGGLGGVLLSSAEFPRVPRAVLDGIVRRANAGRLDTIDEQNAAALRAGDLGRTYTIGRQVFPMRWRTRYGTGIREDGERAPMVFDSPGFASGVRQTDAAVERRLGGVEDAYALVARWSRDNDDAARQYLAAVRDAREQAVENARAVQATAEAQPETAQDRADAAAARARAMRTARIRSERIGDKLKNSTSREFQRLNARLTFIQQNNALTGAYADAIDRGADPAEAAAELVPDVPTMAEVAEVSPIDRLYPLEDVGYYVDTFAALGPEWGALYLGFTDAADLPLAAPQFYVDTFDSLPLPWRNLYNQALLEI